MKKIISLTCLGLLFSIASFALGPITGPSGVCAGGTAYLSDSTFTGGVWTSSNVAVATVGSSSGIVTGVSAGTCTITYTLGTFVTTTITVYTPPAAITGITSFCMGTTSTLSDATPGGTWSSSSPGVASVSGVGVVTGVYHGTANIYYSVGTGCAASTTVTITTTATVGDSIVGPTSVCSGSTITLTDTPSTGTWSSSNPSIATVGPTTGIVTGVSAGSVNISYTVSLGCGTATAYKSITVSSTTSPGTISGSTSVYIGSTTPLYEGIGGGTWSSSNPAVASINATTGVVTGVSAGSATITYTVTGCSGTAYTTAPTSVSLLNRISGHVHLGGMLDSFGTIKVWLITYNPSTLMLEAIDSVALPSSGTSIYYEFLGKPTDSFRVKAADFPTVFTGTGYIPTYHTSSFYWHDANVLYHTGTADDGIDINMAYGTVTAGPGFIAGDVTTGANKGTAGGAPAVGLLIFARNASGTVIQQAYTDATGHYTFSNLPVGNYDVYPEAASYATTPYPTITLTSANPGMTAANFIQHTLSLSITPVLEGVHNVTTSVSSVFTLPNPTTGKLNIEWNINATEKGTVTMADITGRQVYANTIDMNQGSGTFQVDLSDLTNGLYIINIKSGTINYNNKIQVQH